MTLTVRKFELKEWAHLSADVHRIVFGTEKPPDFDRISYALGVEDGCGRPVMYGTVREQDHESVYWQFGGAFPPAQNSIVAYRAFVELIKWQFQHAKRISFLVENDNESMLRLAMKEGFRIIGVRYFKGHILLEHLLEKPSAV